MMRVSRRLRCALISPTLRGAYHVTSTETVYHPPLISTLALTWRGILRLSKVVGACSVTTYYIMAMRGNARTIVIHVTA